MLTPKRLSLLLAATVFVSVVVVILATTRGEGQTATPNGEQVKVLRRKDQHNVPPNAAEVAWSKSQQIKEERQLDDKIPKHLPIRVKIKAQKEKEFKDLGNPHWARDFELEVKNTGTKPIYRLGLLLLLPETEIAGGRLVFPLHYGRTELSVFNDKLELAKPEDIPIAPGETYIFKIPESQVTGWEDSVKTEGWPHPKKIVIKIEEINFGDGSGFRWGDAVFLGPSPARKPVLEYACKVLALVRASQKRSMGDGLIGAAVGV